MALSIGIIGLPNVGKSTLFKALTKKEVGIAAYPFTTIHPNIGIATVPDERLEKIAEIIKPEKTTPTIIEFIDIAGLVKGAHMGEGLGNQFLAQIRSCDAILEVVRAFDDPRVENVFGEINPEKEVGVVRTELLMKDLETLEGLMGKLEKEVKSKEKTSLKKFEILKKIKGAVSEGKPISEVILTEEEAVETKEYQFLTQKPILYLLNGNGKTKYPEAKFNHLLMNLRDEEEISELSESEKKELGLKSGLDQLILACYKLLDLISFYTVAGGKETRIWALRRGKKATEAAATIHTDFEKYFIKAEVINWQDLVNSGSLARAREKGLIRTEGKDYVVRDGDVIEIKAGI